MLDRKDVNEIIGKTDEELGWDPDLLKKIILEDRSVIDSKKSVISEDWIYLMDKDRCFQTEKRPLLYNEEVVGLLCITIDITAEKEAARQLMQALKVTAASISHEMKTPLAGIKNLLDALLKSSEKLNEGYQKAVQEKIIAREEGEPIYDKIKSLSKQALWRIDAASTMISLQIGNMSIDKIDTRFFEQLSMSVVVEQALKKYSLDENEKTLLCWKNNNNFSFIGEKSLTINILWNLMNNAFHAIKHAGKGEVEIWLEKGEAYNYLHFKDTAKGVPLSVKENLFKKFYTNRRDGAGLGLSFCKKVMNSYGGDINCESEEGQYIQFTLKFPSLQEYFRQQEE